MYIYMYIYYVYHKFILPSKSDITSFFPTLSYSLLYLPFPTENLIPWNINEFTHYPTIYTR